MSTYTYRFYEVKTEIVHDSLNKVEDFEEKYIKNTPKTYHPIAEGYTVRIWGADGSKYRIWSDRDKKWHEEEDCRHEWVLLRWYTKPDHSYSPKKYDVVVGDINTESSDLYYKKRTPTCKVGERLAENVCYCDNGGIIRDEYVRRGYGLHDSFEDRGFPKDMSNELKEVLKTEGEYTWGHTYIYLSEWQAEYEKRLAEFKKKLEDIYKEDKLSIIDNKLDLLIRKVKDPLYEEPIIEEKKPNEDDDEYDDDEDEETLESRLNYLWDEDFSDIMSIKGEMLRAYNLIDEPFGYTSDEDIRITYFLA